MQHNKLQRILLEVWKQTQKDYNDKLRRSAGEVSYAFLSFLRSPDKVNPLQTGISRVDNNEEFPDSRYTKRE